MTIKRLVAVSENQSAVFQLDTGVYILVPNNPDVSIGCMACAGSFLKFGYFNESPDEKAISTVATACERAKTISSPDEFKGGKERYEREVEAHRKAVEQMRLKYGSTFKGVPIEDLVF